MSLAYIRRFYGVPAYRGRYVRFDGRLATILSGTHHLHVRFAPADHVHVNAFAERGCEVCGLQPRQIAMRDAWLHPTWRMEYALL